MSGAPGYPRSRRPRRASALRALGSGLLCALIMAACDSGPSGPGTIPATVVPAEGTDLGAIVLAVTGTNVTGFSPAGSTRLFSARVTQAGTYRVVLVNTDPGEMVFGVEVDDVTAEPPVVSFVQGVDSDNLKLVSLLGLSVTFDRP